MDKEKLNQLLDSIYELEGLVHLAIVRDEMPEVLPELIRRKGREVSALLEIAEPKAAPVPEPEPEPFREPEPEPEPFREPEPEPEPFREPEPEPELEPEPIPVPEPEPEPEPISAPDPAPAPAPKPTPAPAPKPAPVVERPVASPEERIDTVNTEAMRGRLVFSINDRYRFKRELFDNSDIQFNATLSMVASMENYEEAEGYFLDELNWNEESEEVKAFLDILKNYFKE